MPPIAAMRWRCCSRHARRFPASLCAFMAKAASPKAATLLADLVRGDLGRRPPDRDRHACQGHQPDHDRHGGQDRHAVKVGAKYSAEHQSLGYHQADIRPRRFHRPGPASNAHLCAERRRPALHPLWLCRSLSGRPQIRCALPAMAGHPAPSAMGRSGPGGGVRAQRRISAARRGWS